MHGGAPVSRTGIGPVGVELCLIGKLPGVGSRVDVVYETLIVDGETMADPRAGGDMKRHFPRPVQHVAVRHTVFIRQIHTVLLNLDDDAGIRSCSEEAGMHRSLHHAKSSIGKLPISVVPVVVTAHQL